MSMKWPPYVEEYDTYTEMFKREQLRTKRQYALNELADFWLELDDNQKEMFKEFIKDLSKSKLKVHTSISSLEPDVNMSKTVYSKDGKKVGLMEFKFKFEEE